MQINNYNFVTLSGKIVGDPELRAISSKTRDWKGHVYTFRLMARGMGEKGAPGFVEVSVFDGAEHASEAFPKGAEVDVYGKLRFREWEPKPGTKRSVLSLVGQVYDPGEDPSSVVLDLDPEEATPVAA